MGPPWGRGWPWLQLGLSLYSYITDLLGNPYSLAPGPLISCPNPHTLCCFDLCMRGCVWIPWLVLGKDALFAWEKAYKKMLWRACLWYLHVSSLLITGLLFLVMDKWPVLNHPDPSPYPILSYLTQPHLHVSTFNCTHVIFQNILLLPWATLEILCYFMSISGTTNVKHKGKQVKKKVDIQQFLGNNSLLFRNLLCPHLPQ